MKLRPIDIALLALLAIVVFTLAGLLYGAMH